MYLIMEVVICYVSDNAGSNMLKKTLSWVMVGMLFLSLVFNENLVTRRLMQQESYRKYNEKMY